MWRPSVSVVMCTYNGAQFIREQINSILAQTYPVREFLIFDDGSTDDTVAIIESYVKEYPLIKFHQNESNLGYNFNFQQALLAASSQIIAIADQDDYWHSQKLQKIVAAFHDPEVVLVHSAKASLKGNKRSTRAARQRYLFQGSDPRPLFFANQIPGHAMVVRRSLLPHIIPIPEGMYYDWWIAVTAACNGRVKAVVECLVTHRLHGQNAFFQREKRGNKVKPELLEILAFLKHIRGLKKEDAIFLRHLYRLVKQHRAERPFFNLSLFYFLWKHRNTFFGYKKRSFPTFTHLKYSLLHAHSQMWER